MYLKTDFEYNGITLVHALLISLFLAGSLWYLFSYIYGWSILSICYWDWEHWCRFCSGYQEVYAQGSLCSRLTFVGF